MIMIPTNDEIDERIHDEQKRLAERIKDSLSIYLHPTGNKKQKIPYDEICKVIDKLVAETDLYYYGF